MNKNRVMTELEAVNYMMLSIGDQPVNSLNETRSSHVNLAKQLLLNISRQVQSRGLRCNTEYGFKFNLTPVKFDEKIIRIPDNVLRIDASDSQRKVVLRGNKIYDIENHTHNFDKNIEFDAVWFLEFKDLPQVVKDYITIKASRVFQSKIIGSTEQLRQTSLEEQEAYSRLVIEEIDSGDYNMLSHPEVISQNRRF